MRFTRLLLLMLALEGAGCHVLRTTPALPVRHSLVRDQLIIYSDFTLPARHRLLNELVALRDDVEGRLTVPMSMEPIHVYLFRSDDQFRDFVDRYYPDFPTRRAFFLESDTRLAVYAHWGDRVAEDLRHEVAHGYLHATVSNLPLWLDEGLAEYFEVPRGHNGLNRPHVRQLRELASQEEWQPDLAHLEHLTTAMEMTQVDYAESWAWAHLLLETTPARREFLRNYLTQLRENGKAPPLSLALEKAEPNAADALLTHLSALAVDADTQAKQALLESQHRADEGGQDTL